MIIKVMKKLSISILMISWCVCLHAQTKTFVLEELFTSRKLYADNLQQLQWVSTSNDFVYVVDSTLMKANVANTNPRVFVPLADINKALLAVNLNTVKNFPAIQHWSSVNGFYFRSQNFLLHYRIDLKQIDKQIPIVKEAENLQIDYDRQQIAYTVENDLFVIKADRQAVRVNKKTASDIRFGHIVHRNEFGVEQGSFWSPKGNYLAFYRMDESMVTDYPLVNTSTRIATLKNEKYPMAGETSHQVSLGVYNMNTKTIVYMQTGEPADQYLTSITWSLDEKYIFIGILNREQNHLKMNQYNAVTGEYVKTLFEEKNERYVEPMCSLYFLANQPNHFVWVSRRDGWNHLYLYDISGKLIRQLTKGNWEVKSIAGFNEKSSCLFFYSNKDEIVGNHFYQLDIKSGSIRHITQELGMHRVRFSNDGLWFLDTYNNLTTANEIKLKNNKGKEKAVLLPNRNHLSDYALPETKLMTIKNKNGDDLYCRLIYPINFDSLKKYPVFIYVYGGPHSQMVTNGWLSGGWFLHYMAQKGYIVFTLDNRGTNYRGFEFESCIHRHLGDFEVEDQMCGVDYLKSLKYVDTERLSIDGWSYGGFMTLSMFLRNPGVFNRASCGGPVIDWKYYEVMYGERYMDTPQDNKEGYEKSSLLNYVDSIEGKILIFHGAMDPTVVWQNSLQFIEKSIKAKKQVDYFVYPSHGHNVGGIDRVHLWKKIEDFHTY